MNKACFSNTGQEKELWARFGKTPTSIHPATTSQLCEGQPKVTSTILLS